MRRTVAATEGCNPPASSFEMKRRNPLWMTLLIFTPTARRAAVRRQVRPSGPRGN